MSGAMAGPCEMVFLLLQVSTVSSLSASQKRTVFRSNDHVPVNADRGVEPRAARAEVGVEGGAVPSPPGGEGEGEDCSPRIPFWSRQGDHSQNANHYGSKTVRAEISVVTMGASAIRCGLGHTMVSGRSGNDRPCLIRATGLEYP